jgi:molybdopterin molybdotransferase
MQLHFDKVEIKPGKPTAFGTIGDTVVINLPGNPLASMVNYEIFVRAAIRKMSGMNACYHSTITTQIKEDFTLRPGKYTVRLGTFDSEGFMPFTKQLPGMLSPLEQANAMLITTPEVSKLEKGRSVKVLPISWELSTSRKENFFTH